ncbi:hypothetical protein IFM61606_03987 [Aspergillus udagawae]|nr:hypothetical protein IFM61606_03987 [Aspergillus udagawae]
MSCDKNTERTLRLRENKRRNRARQKEYTADLERRLRKFEQEGVRATVEIQTAAKKVAEENIYLRELLLVLGIDRLSVNDWITRRRSPDGAKDSHQCHEVAGDRICNKGKEGPSCAPSSQLQCSLPCNTVCQSSSCPLSDSIPKPADHSSSTAEDSQVPDMFSSPGRSKSTSDSRQETSCHDAGLAPDEPRTPGEGSSRPPPAPCKLLTRLAANPASDVSTILAGLETEQKADRVEGGLPCESAYKLLMRYATSEEKIEALARSLEEGCVPNSSGGCKVKNQTVSQALLDLCL